MVKHISKHLGHLTVSGFWIALKQFSWKWFVLKSVRLAPLHYSIHFLDKLLCFISIKGHFKIIFKRFLVCHILCLLIFSGIAWQNLCSFFLRELVQLSQSGYSDIVLQCSPHIFYWTSVTDLLLDGYSYTPAVQRSCDHSAAHYSQTIQF